MRIGGDHKATPTGATTTGATTTSGAGRASGAANAAAVTPTKPPAPQAVAPTHVPSVAPKRDLKAGLYDAPLPDRRLPPLHEALADPRIAPLSPAVALDVPEETLAVLRNAKRVLVIGHVPPDGDCLGAALGLARTLRALGKEAQACVDADLQGQLRGLPEGDVRRAAELEGPFDLVVLVDVAQGDRIGRAREHVAAAKNVLVIDHHVTKAARDEVGVSPAATLTRFVKPGLEAACLQVAALAERLGAEQGPAGKTLDADAWREISIPLCAGTLTDTGSFRMPGASLDAMRMFKHMVGHLPGGARGVSDVEDRLAWELPTTATQALLTGEGAAEVHHVRFPSPKADIIAAPRAALDAAMTAARAHDPGVLEMDVKGNLLDRLDRAAGKNEVAVLVTESDAGVQVSVRTKDAALAVELVEQVFPGKGGGKPHVAAARPGGNLDDVIGQISRWLEARRASDRLSLRSR